MYFKKANRYGGHQGETVTSQLGWQLVFETVTMSNNSTENMRTSCFPKWRQRSHRISYKHKKSSLGRRWHRTHGKGL